LYQIYHHCTNFSRKGRLRAAEAPYEQVQASLAESAEVKKRLAALNAQIDVTRRVPPGSGYLRRFEEASDRDVQPIPYSTQNVWVIGLLLALIVSVGCVYLLEMLDSAIRTDADIKRHLNYSVSAIIPTFDEELIQQLELAKTTPVTEIFDRFATVLRAPVDGVVPRTILVVSAQDAEGKSTFSLQLGAALARQKRAVTVVDADLRIPTLHKLLQTPQEPGLSELLEAAGEPSEELLGTAYRPTPIPGMRLIPAGTRTGLTYSLLDPEPTRRLLERLKQESEFVIIDTPPLLRTSDAMKLAGVVDGIVLLIQSGRLDKREAVWVKNFIEDVHPRPPWVVLNRVPRGEEAGYYYYYYYSYYDREHRRAGR
jgi:capsular exopolysaccharide synthesis family protein